MKYVIVNVNGIETPIIISELMSHVEVSSNYNVISAGFCSFESINNELVVHCYGESVSLRKKSRKEIDAEIIKYHHEFRC